MGRWLTVGLAGIGGWILGNLILLVFLPLLLLWALVGGAPGRTTLGRICLWLIRFFFLRYLPLIGFYTVVEQPQPAELARLKGCLLVANHRSWLDGIFLLALVPGVCLPLNPVYLRVPIVGQAMRWLGCFPLDQRDPESVLSGYRAGRRILARPAPLGVFPEGRRSKDGRLRPFAEMFFRLALEEGVAVYPLVIHSDLPYLAPGRTCPLTPRRLRWTIRLLDPLTPESGGRDSELSRQVQRIMASELKLLDSD